MTHHKCNKFNHKCNKLATTRKCSFRLFKEVNMYIFNITVKVYSVNRIFPMPNHSYLTPNLTYCFPLKCQISVNKKCYRKGLNFYALFSTIEHMHYFFLQ